MDARTWDVGGAASSASGLRRVVCGASRVRCGALGVLAQRWKGAAWSAIGPITAVLVTPFPRGGAVRKADQ